MAVVQPNLIRATLAIAKQESNICSTTSATSTHGAVNHVLYWVEPTGVPLHQCVMSDSWVMLSGCCNSRRCLRVLRMIEYYSVLCWMKNTLRRGCSSRQRLESVRL